MSFRHAARTFLHRFNKPIIFNASQVKSMQVRQTNNVVNAVLDRFNVYRWAKFWSLRCFGLLDNEFEGVYQKDRRGASVGFS